MPPCQKRRKKSGDLSTWPYLQPLSIPEYNWLEPRLIQDAIYAQNLYMTLHKVPPPIIEELRPVPYTHIEIPEYLKPRRYKNRKRQRPANGSPQDGGTYAGAAVGSRSHSEAEDINANRRGTKSTLSADSLSTSKPQS